MIDLNAWGHYAWVLFCIFSKFVYHLFFAFWFWSFWPVVIFVSMICITYSGCYSAKYKWPMVFSIIVLTFLGWFCPLLALFFYSIPGIIPSILCGFCVLVCVVSFLLLGGLCMMMCYNIVNHPRSEYGYYMGDHDEYLSKKEKEE